MDSKLPNGEPSLPALSLDGTLKPPRSANTSKQSSARRSERDKIYDSISESTMGIRRYSAGDARRPSATLRNITHSSRMGYPSSTPRDDSALSTLDEETARDPRDTASPLTPASPSQSSNSITEKPTLDFDGLSWPSMNDCKAHQDLG